MRTPEDDCNELEGRIGDVLSGGLHALPPVDGLDLDTQWRRTHARIRGARGNVWGRPSRRTPAWIAGATAMTLLVAAGVMVGKQRLGASAAAPAFRESVTARGQRMTTTLGDGSKVVLGVASRLRTTANFGPDGRDVYLDGEAYFEVASHTGAPFVVHTQQGDTRVLGTRFAVRAYKDAPVMQVVVTEGRVSMALKTILSSGQVGHVGPGIAPSVASADTASALAWINGRLTFDHAPVGDVAVQLERWHDIDFRFASPDIAKRRLTATFRAESVGETLDIIALSLGLRYELHGKVVVFRNP